MASLESLSDEDKQFLSACEELLKLRYTENDKEFMKVHKAEASKPPIVESWWVPTNSGRRHERRGGRRGPYERPRQQDSRRAPHSGGRPHSYHSSHSYY